MLFHIRQEKYFFLETQNSSVFKLVTACKADTTCSVVQCSVVQCSVAQCSVVQCSVVQRSVAQRSVLQCVSTHRSGRCVGARAAMSTATACRACCGACRRRPRVLQRSGSAHHNEADTACNTFVCCFTGGEKTYVIFFLVIFCMQPHR